MTYHNDTASSLARPHVTGETIHSYNPSRLSISKDAIDKPHNDAPLPIDKLQSEKQTSIHAILTDHFEDEVGSDRIFRFHRKAER
jgi:hypothetical protein